MKTDLYDYPIAVIEDRYSGAYSGGAWLAVSQCDLLENGRRRVLCALEDGPNGDDTEAAAFWDYPPKWIAAGDTPDAAIRALEMNRRQPVSEGAR